MSSSGFILFVSVTSILKRAETSLTFTVFSWFIERTLHVREDNSSPHGSCLTKCCNPTLVSVLQHVLQCCSIPLRALWWDTPAASHRLCDLLCYQAANWNKHLSMKEKQTDQMASKTEQKTLKLQLQNERTLFSCCAYWRKIVLLIRLLSGRKSSWDKLLAKSWKKKKEETQRECQ